MCSNQRMMRNLKTNAKDEYGRILQDDMGISCTFTDYFKKHCIISSTSGVEAILTMAEHRVNVK